jgi:hypothetical protein
MTGTHVPRLQGALQETLGIQSGRFPDALPHSYVHLANRACDGRNLGPAARRERQQAVNDRDFSLRRARLEAVAEDRDLDGPRDLGAHELQCDLGAVVLLHARGRTHAAFLSPS